MATTRKNARWYDICTHQRKFIPFGTASVRICELKIAIATSLEIEKITIY